LLAKILLAFAVKFDERGEVSLAISANILRVTEKDGVRVRDLTRLSGVSKEAVAIAVKFLAQHGFAIVGSDTRTKLLHLTAKGIDARQAYAERMKQIEDRLEMRFGAELMRELRQVLQLLCGDPSATSPLLAGLQPYPENWRAKVAQPDVLPHFPMVLHRGGYPDGS
jgi:hypothetical protein